MKYRLRSDDGRYASCQFSNGINKPVLLGEAHAYTFDTGDWTADATKEAYEAALGVKLNIEEKAT